MVEPLDRRLWAVLASRSKVTEDGCREWLRGKALGYGKLWWGGKVQLTHRLAWIAWFGPIEEGKFVCHHCDNPSCIEVSHLFVGTQKDNMRDCASKGRTLPQKRRINFTVGEDRHSAKLTQAQIEEVIRRRVAGETYTQIAVDYPISRQQISRVCRGLSWQHLRCQNEAEPSLVGGGVL